MASHALHSAEGRPYSSLRQQYRRGPGKTHARHGILPLLMSIPAVDAVVRWWKESCLALADMNFWEASSMLAYRCSAIAIAFKLVTALFIYAGTFCAILVLCLIAAAIVMWLWRAVVYVKLLSLKSEFKRLFVSIRVRVAKARQKWSTRGMGTKVAAPSTSQNKVDVPTLQTSDSSAPSIASFLADPAAASTLAPHVFVPRCAGCGEDRPGMETCSRCKAVYFCSRECQKKAWKWHKNDCHEPVAGLPAGGETSPSASQPAQKEGKGAPSAAKPDRAAKESAKHAQVASTLQAARDAMASGHPNEARRHAELCARAAKKVHSSRHHAEALRIQGQACLQLDDTTAAEQAYNAMVDVTKESGDLVMQGEALIGLGDVAGHKPNNEAAAMAFYDKAIKLVRQAPDAPSDAMVSMEASARSHRGLALSELGRRAEAVQELRQVVTLRRLGAAAASADQAGGRNRWLACSLLNLVAVLDGAEDVASSKEERRQLLMEAMNAARAAGDVQAQLSAQTRLDAIR